MLQKIKCMISAFRIARDLSHDCIFSTLGIYTMQVECILPLIVVLKLNNYTYMLRALTKAVLVICIEKNADLNSIGKLVKDIILHGDSTKLLRYGYKESLLRISTRY